MAGIDRSVVKHLSLFSELGEAEIDALLSEARAVRFAKGARVFEQGGEAHAFYVLLHGHLQAVKTTPNCGVRVVEGRHRTHMTDFIRDPQTGGCSVGTPPANLGFRPVRED
jgi:hypothetical protein